MEAVRIRSVSDPTFPKAVLPGMSRMLATDGFLGFYAGLGPIVAKQVPYSMAKFAVQGKAAEMMYKSAGKGPSDMSTGANLSISLTSGVISGVVAAIVSHPADTLLSKINKAGAGGKFVFYTLLLLFFVVAFRINFFFGDLHHSGSTMSRLFNIAKEMGFVRLCLTGLPAR
jgi:solute carrier family 25 (mitochondrial phosphate transporter), member 3